MKVLQSKQSMIAVLLLTAACMVNTGLSGATEEGAQGINDAIALEPSHMNDSVLKKDQSFALMLTPVIFSDRDFDKVEDDIARFFDYHREFFQDWKEIIIIFAVGNADQMLEYRGPEYMDDTFPASMGVNDEGHHIPAQMSLKQIKHIVATFRREGHQRGYNIKVFDMLDPGPEFVHNDFKFTRHPEILYLEQKTGYRRVLDATAKMKADKHVYATQPDGIPDGYPISDFTAEQCAAYCRDLNIDGINLCNGYGTTVFWNPEEARGYSDWEAREVLHFFKYMNRTMGEKDVFWMDTYWNTQVEHDAWSVTPEVYPEIDYIQISAWSGIRPPSVVRENLASKLPLDKGGTKIILQIDYQDPWYVYNSVSARPDSTDELLDLLRNSVSEVEGVYINGNSEKGEWLSRYWLDRINDLYLVDDTVRENFLLRRTRRDLEKIFGESAVDRILFAAIAKAKYEGYMGSVGKNKEAAESYIRSLQDGLDRVMNLKDTAIVDQLAAYLCQDVIHLTRFQWATPGNKWTDLSKGYDLVNVKLRNFGPEINAVDFATLYDDGQAGNRLNKTVATGADIESVCKVKVGDDRLNMLGDLSVTYQYPLVGKAQGSLSVQVHDRYAPSDHWVMTGNRAKGQFVTIAYGPDGLKITKTSKLQGFQRDLPPSAYVRNWNYLGPFTCGDVEQFTGKPGIIEMNKIDLDAEYTDATGAKTTWQQRDYYWIASMDLMGVYANAKQPTNKVYAYAYSEVYVPKDVEAVFHIGCKNGFKLMVNENLEFEHTDKPGEVKEDYTPPNRFEVKVSLTRGWNPIVVRTWNRTMRWEFSVRIEAPGLAPDQLKYSAGRNLTAKTRVNKQSNKTPWDLEALSKVPRVFPVEDFREPGVKAFFYEGLPWKGNPTRVFAWYGAPEDGGEKLPAMVLVHGGTGTADADWVRSWNARGYAAIAMDTNGTLPIGDHPRARHDWAGPPAWDASFWQTDWPLEDQWTYHAVADVILANSLLRSYPEIDPDRIGVHGLSWGGYLTCIAAGVDSRFKLAIPVYGCGFLRESYWSRGPRSVFQQMGDEKATKWTNLWDPSQYLGYSAMDMLWINGTNDGAYYLDSFQKSYRLPTGRKTLSIRVRMPHGQEGGDAEENFVFADSILRDGTPLATLTRQGQDGNTVWADFNCPVGVSSAKMNYTTDLGPWTNRGWNTSDANIDLVNNRISAILPPGTSTYYFSLIDERGLIVSTEHVEMANP